MPTILFIRGWRFFFYANEGNEPIHIHCAKGDAEAKYWLLVEQFDLAEAFSHGMSQPDRRIVRSIIFENFDYIVDEWDNFQERKHGQGA